MKQLIVCGDSFMSPRINHPKKHFAEIFAEHYGFELTSYARSGFSNGGIVIQLETAIQKNPDFILLNFTSSDRIEFSINVDQLSLSKYLQLPLTLQFLGDCRTQLPDEMSDPFYVHHDDRLIASENLVCFLSKVNLDPAYDIKMKNKYLDWENKVDAVQKYYKFLYDETWKNQVDQMMMHTMMYRLEKSNIPYIIVLDYLGLTKTSTYKPDWITQKHSVHELVNDIRQKMSPPNGSDPGFHLTYEGSQAVANVLIEHYNRYF